MSNYVPDIFGRILSTDNVEDAIEETLRTWMPTYLEELRLQHGMPSTKKFQAPQSYNIRPDYERWAEEKLPAIITVPLGPAAAPFKDGEGSYTSPMRIALVAFAQGNDKATTNRNTKVYGAAVRAILLQQRSLGGLCEETVWEGEEFNEGITDAQGRSIASVVNTFVFHIHHVLDHNGGPAFPTPPDPETQPGSTWPPVEHPGPTEVEKVAITDEV